MSILGTLVTDFKAAGGKVKAFILKVAGDAPAIVATVAADEAKIAPVIEAFIPGSTQAMTVADSVVNAVAQAVEDSGSAATANGLSVTLDQAIINDVKAVITAAKSWAGTKTATPAA